MTRSKPRATSTRPEALLATAQQEVARKQYPEALSTAEGALAQRPDWVDALGLALYAAAKLENVGVFEMHARAAQTLAPEKRSQLSDKKIGNLALLAGAHERAAEIGSALIAKAPGSRAGIFLSASAAWEIGDEPAAERIIAGALAHGSEGAVRAVVDYCLRLDDVEEAARLSETCGQLDDTVSVDIEVEHRPAEREVALLAGEAPDHLGAPAHSPSERSSRVGAPPTRAVAQRVAQVDQQRVQVIATRAAESVEFTSPGTSTTSGKSRFRSGSMAVIAFAVCSAVTARPNVEEVIGTSNAELIEEHLAHRVVVVLSGVNHYGVKFLRARPKAPNDWQRFHEVRTGPDDDRVLQWAVGHRADATAVGRSPHRKP